MTELEFINQAILGNTLMQWALAITVLVLGFILLRLARRVATNRLASLASRTDTKWDDIIVEAIKHTRPLFMLMVSIFLASMFLQLPERALSIIHVALIIFLLVQLGIWLTVITISMVEHYSKQTLATNPAAATTMNAVGFISRIVIWSVITLVALDSMGINVTTVIAGLGIGGVAVALAVQNILGDLFASLSIILDKPFVIGDFLIIDEHMGGVEYIGLKTTRVRSLSGEQLIFSNSDLLQSRIRNYGRMFERRVVFNIGVIYSTPRDKLKRIPEIIRDAVNTQEKTRFDRSHFMKYGDYALQFETVYYVKSPDYNIYMDIQQSIYFAIHEAFEQEQIDFAYPTQKLFVAQTSM
ncbi:MAG: mechanosensitive ion channel family protein [Gammaproteobacteria bacterium]|jgi:small-conductance mechanosensitive channel